MITTVVTISGGIFLILIGIIIAMQNSKIDRIDDELDNKAKKCDVNKKADITMCDQRYGELLARLDRGNSRFDGIDKKLDDHTAEQIKQGKVLVKVLTIVERLDKNGIPEKSKSDLLT